MMLIRNQNGCHVVKKILSLVYQVDFRKQKEDVLKIMRYVAKVVSPADFKSTCNNQYGVIVMKQIILILNSTRVDKSELATEFIEIKKSFYQ